MYKKIFIAVLALSLLLGAAAPASAQTSTTSPAVMQYLNELLALRQLRQGMSGEDVKLLQSILASQPDLYPEGIVSGYYGALTSKAVAKFQAKHGLPAVGQVGPQTLKKVNDLFKDHVKLEDRNGSSTPCVSLPPGHLIAPGQLKKRDGKPIMISACQKLPFGIMKKLGSTTPPTGTTTPTTTPTTSPVISSVVTGTTTSTTTVQVTWVTNQLTTGWVWYGTTTPLVATTTTLKAGSNAYTFGHIVNLAGLATSTTYYYVVTSTNLAGLTSTSSQGSFIVPAQ